MRVENKLLSILVAALLCGWLSSCGGGGGDQIPINGVPGTGGDKFTELQPPVTKPVAEIFLDHALPDDTTGERWVSNLYATLPALTSAAGVYQNASTKAWADQIFLGVNQNRLNGGKLALIRNKYLDAIAQAHARDMALRHYFAHRNPEGMEFIDRLNAVNPPRYDHLGETAARGQETVQEVTSGWLGSEKHFKISMDPEYEYAGVGVYCDVTNAQMPMHIIMVFAEFRDDPASYTGWLAPGT
ncbi:CAP domain-containing protein [bacterium]|nr:CAP domain-containing protein [bacterium]